MLPRPTYTRRLKPSLTFTRKWPTSTRSLSQPQHCPSFPSPSSPTPWPPWPSPTTPPSRRLPRLPREPSSPCWPPSTSWLGTGPATGLAVSTVWAQWCPASSNNLLPSFSLSLNLTMALYQTDSGLLDWTTETRLSYNFNLDQQDTPQLKYIYKAHDYDRKQTKTEKNNKEISILVPWVILFVQYYNPLHV